MLRERGVVVNSAPRAEGAMAPERAGPERANRCVETWAAEGRTTRVRAASGTLGRMRRRVGGLRSMRSPSDRS